MGRQQKLERRPEARKVGKERARAKRAMQIFVMRMQSFVMKCAALNDGSRWKSGRDCMVKVNLVRRLVRRARQTWATRSNAVIFGNIYENRLWGVGSDPEVPFYSGIGSYDPAVIQYVSLVIDVINRYDIRNVIEIGCGDFTVASQYVDKCQTLFRDRCCKGFGRAQPKNIWNQSSKFLVCRRQQNQVASM